MRRSRSATVSRSAISLSDPAIIARGSTGLAALTGGPLTHGDRQGLCFPRPHDLKAGLLAHPP